MTPLLLPLSLAFAAAADPPPADPSLVEGMGDIVVVGLRGPDPSLTPASVTVIPIDTRLSSGADVASVVDSASGTTVVELGGLGSFSAVSIRGSTLRQVAVFLDGVPLNPDGSDTVNLSELPLQAFSRVELYRGNAPPEFSAAPMGGVVNLVSAEVPGPSTVAVSGGSYHTGRFNAFTTPTGELGPWELDGLLTAELFTTAADYAAFDDNGTLYNLADDAVAPRLNNEKDQLAATARLRARHGRLRLTLLDAWLSRDEGLPGPVHLPALEASLDTRRNLGVMSLERCGEASALTLRLWQLDRRELFDDLSGELGSGGQQIRGDTRDRGGLAHAVWTPAPWVSPSLTLSVHQERYIATDLVQEEEALPRSRLGGSASLASTFRFNRDRWTLSPVVQAQAWHALRLDEPVFEYDAAQTEPTTDLLALNPRLGVLYRPTPALALKANGGHTIRPPDLTELFGDRGAMAGNTTLKPERGWQWDVGGRLVHSGRHLSGSLDLSHYWSASEDLITWMQNAQRVLIPVNVGEAWVQGLELAVSLDLGGHLDSQSNLTRTLSRNLVPIPAVSNNQLPRVPTWELGQATSLHWEERARIGHTWSFTDGNYWDATNWFRSAPRSIHGAFLRLQPSAAWPSMELAGLNLLDRFVEVVPRDPLRPSGARAVQPITDFAGYPLPGRTLLFTLRWQS